jgi:hypothetical protein
MLGLGGQILPPATCFTLRERGMVGRAARPSVNSHRWILERHPPRIFPDGSHARAFPQRAHNTIPLILPSLCFDFLLWSSAESMEQGRDVHVYISNQ